MSPRKDVTFPRVLMIGLDGFEVSLAETLMADGELPNLARLHARSARYRLDHGRDKLSGLAWEHISSGVAPSDGGRWSAVTFDPISYGVRQDLTRMVPFVAWISSRTVVFDIPYFDLAQAPQVQGMTNWGAHDPGVPTICRPADLWDEMSKRFGPYPATESIYGFTWPSSEKTIALSDALVRAVEVRAKAARWMLEERLPDWDLAIVVVAEGHSAIEPLWHGIDPAHPLHGIASAQPAAQGIRSVYRAIDRLVGELCEAFPDAIVLSFAMHGMGPNDGDVASMALLPELLYRHAFGRPYMRPWSPPGALPDGTPLLDEDADWDAIMRQAIPAPDVKRHWLIHRFGKLTGALPPADADQFAKAPNSCSIDWMPAARYRPFWHRMQAFALPAFYNGYVRINLAGRESRGKVTRSRYREVCEQIVKLMRDCRDAQTGEPAVAEIHWGEKDPMSIGPSEGDLYVDWRSAPLGLRSTTLGTIGPLPYRRTGGHTGQHGFLYVAGDGIAARDAGVASSFDVLPTVLDLLGERPQRHISGRSLAGTIRVAA